MPEVKKGKKPKVKIPEEDLINLDEGTVSPKDLAEKHGITPNTVSILKHKRKLKTTMKLNLADKNIASKQKIVSDQSKPQGELPPAMTQEKVYDYDTLVSGLWSGVDAILLLVATVSRGQIVYEKLTPQEIDTLTNASKNNTLIQKIATLEHLSALMMVGTIIVVFRGKMKIVYKHKEDDLKCKCDDCKLLRKEIKELPKQKQKEEKKVDEIVKNLEKNTKSDQPNAKFDLDGNGLRIENNVSKENKTEEQVLEQNKKETIGQKQLGESLQW